ncbi:MAG: YwmB family TATA-box binding protein [Alicyclobacillus sp.]|nr:YwmB family TATA-box binding protein [Alicyclobacillus sp.]
MISGAPMAAAGTTTAGTTTAGATTAGAPMATAGTTAAAAKGAPQTVATGRSGASASAKVGSPSGSAGPMAVSIPPESRAIARFTEQAFTATGAEVSGYAVNTWSQVSATYETDRQIGQLLDKVVQELGIQNAKKISRQSGGDGHAAESIAEVYGAWADETRVSATVSSFRFTNQQAETLLVISAASTGHDLKQYEREIATVQSALQGVGLQPEIRACIEGSRGAMMSGGQAEAVIRHAFQSVEAKSVEGVQTSGLVSISGYSTEMPQYILTRGQKMNIQIGIHNDVARNRTNVVVGTPVITVTY